MRSHQRESVEILDRFLDELGEPLPSPERTRSAVDRVLESVSLLQHVTEASKTAVRPVPNRRWIPAAAIAAMLVVAVLVGTLAMPGSAQTMAKRVNGKLITSGDRSLIRSGQAVRTDSAGGAVLSLRDGSRVEMGAGVELSIDSAADGIRINLAEGNVIVTAAKQHNGHLYVKTRDCIVSVVGTVFSVNAEAAGSRVAVFEGEVHVQHGAVSENLLPGQQVATNPAMTAVPLQSEIGWSQDAVSHMAMLQQSTPPAPEAQDGVPLAVPPNPVDSLRPVIKDKSFFFSLFSQQQNGQQGVLTPAAQTGIFRYFNKWNGAAKWNAAPTSGGAALANGVTLNADNLLRAFSSLNGTAASSSYSFIFSGIQGRTLSFTNEKGATFSYGCADCSFTVLESGITDNATTPGPGIVFKLSADGGTLGVTCKSAQCQSVNLSASGGGGWQQPPSLGWAAKPLANGAVIAIPVAELLSLPVDSTTGPATNRQAVIFSFAK